MKVKELLNSINEFAPFFLQESYDNSGIQFGDEDAEISKIVLALETTASSVNFAKETGANVLLTHHPILFFALKKITRQKNPVLYEAISHGLNVIAAHTNFDIAEGGLNDYVGKVLEIEKEKPLQVSNEKVYKFSFYVPEKFVERVREAVFDAGAGKIGNYDKASFNVSGTGTFRPLEGTNPFIGEIGKLTHVDEVKVETVVLQRNLGKVINALLTTHPYEEPAYDIYEVKITPASGIGMVGRFSKRYALSELAEFVKRKLGARYVRYVGSPSSPVQKVALCTGAGSSLIDTAKANGVDVFITGDITYHTAVHSKEIGLNLIDVEHFDSEKFFVPAMKEKLTSYVDGVEIVEFHDEKSPFGIL